MYEIEITYIASENRCNSKYLCESYDSISGYIILVSNINRLYIREDVIFCFTAKEVIV